MFKHIYDFKDMVYKMAHAFGWIDNLPLADLKISPDDTCEKGPIAVSLCL